MLINLSNHPSTRWTEEQKQNDIKCIASTTERKSVEKEDGSKISVFRFVQFREY